MYVLVSEDAASSNGLKKYTSLLDTTESLSSPVTLSSTPRLYPLLVVFLYDATGQQPGGAQGEQGTCYKRELVVGCIKSALVKKQTGEFTIEPIGGVVNPLAKCFTIEPLKVCNSIVVRCIIIYCTKVHHSD